MSNKGYEIIETKKGVPIKAWTIGVPFDDNSKKQLRNTATLPFIYKWLAVMPDVHVGLGSTIGSIIPTIDAIIPASVGVDIGCGMMAMKTSITSDKLPDNLHAVRKEIEKAVPHGITLGRINRDKGSWYNIPEKSFRYWDILKDGFQKIVHKHPKIEKSNNLNQLGTLGTGNHFIELCIDEEEFLWIMLHSGSRGVGNLIGRYFIELAKKDMERHHIQLPDKDLSYLKEGSQYFDDYIDALHWAQSFAWYNRQLMMENIVDTLKKSTDLPEFQLIDQAVNCHHNYVAKEYHFGKQVWITRKGAIKADKGYLGIIPGSMGAKSFIVRGKGNPESFNSCSHGAGRVMSRNEAKKRYSIEDQIRSTNGVECRKDKNVIDEIPMAYKSIDNVMKAQSDLVEVVHTLKQIVCVKG